MRSVPVIFAALVLASGCAERPERVPSLHKEPAPPGWKPVGMRSIVMGWISIPGGPFPVREGNIEIDSRRDESGYVRTSVTPFVGTKAPAKSAATVWLETVRLPPPYPDAPSLSYGTGTYDDVPKGARWMTIDLLLNGELEYGTSVGSDGTRSPALRRSRNIYFSHAIRYFDEKLRRIGEEELRMDEDWVPGNPKPHRRSRIAVRKTVRHPRFVVLVRVGHRHAHHPGFLDVIAGMFSRGFPPLATHFASCRRASWTDRRAGPSVTGARGRREMRPPPDGLPRGRTLPIPAAGRTAMFPPKPSTS